MKLLIVIVFAIILTACNYQPNQGANAPANAATATATQPSEAPHWDYEEKGPAKWSDLSSEWRLCGDGKAQSPIDIRPGSTVDLPDVSVQSKPVELRIVHNEHKADGVNNGHTIQINYSDADTLDIEGRKFDLVQYHFHAPSEHTLNGKQYPMEMHMVHQSDDKKLAVLGVLIAEGAKTNEAFEPIWSNLPQTKGAEMHLTGVKIDVDQLLPRSDATYRYDGSLTTPPCSEGVKWIVFATPIQMSSAQITKFKRLIEANNRPVQPLNDRVVVHDNISEKK